MYEYHGDEQEIEADLNERVQAYQENNEDQWKYEEDRVNDRKKNVHRRANGYSNTEEFN